MSSVEPLPRLSLDKAVGTDLDAVMEVMNAAFDPAFGEAWTRTQCAGILPMTGVALTLARAAERPLGFSLVRSVGEESELLLIAVAPEARRRGVGAALLDKFVEDSRARGITRLHLEVRDGNPAIAMYHKHDFTLAGRRTNYYRGRDGELFDALTLSRLI